MNIVIERSVSESDKSLKERIIRYASDNSLPVADAETVDTGDCLHITTVPDNAASEEQNGTPACDTGTLYVGGRITCPASLEICSKYSINPRVLGGLLNLLNVKIRHCSLGCFE